MNEQQSKKIEKNTINFEKHLLFFRFYFLENAN